MAQELVLMAKGKYDALTKSRQTVKTNENEQTYYENVPSVHCNTGPKEEERCDQLNLPVFCDIIRYTIPEKMQRKAMGLIQYLQHHGGDSIKWNQRGQIIVNGEVIQGSHVVDLLRDAVCPKTVHRPIGHETFYQALKAVDTPRSFIANISYTNAKPDIKHASQKGDGYIVKKRTKGPPPGYTPPKKKRGTEIKWIKF